MGPSSKAPEDPDFGAFPVPLSSFQQQMKVKLHTNEYDHLSSFWMTIAY